MDGSTSEASQLNLPESSVSRATSAELTTNSNSDLVEQLSKRLRVCESENLELRRALPRLRDAKGDPCTEWAIQIVNELEEGKRKLDESQRNLAALSQKHRAYREKAEQEARQNAKLIDELRSQADALEQEIKELRDQRRDDQSMIFKLRHGQMDDEADGSDQSRSSELVGALLSHLDQRSRSEMEEILEANGHGTQRSLNHSLLLQPTVQELQKIITVLFEKLRSAADLFGRLQNFIGNSPDADLLDRIRSMKLDLNQSVERYKRRVEELTSAPTSAESSFRDSEEHNKKFKLVESERDALRAKLNNEIVLKERYMERSESTERNLREAKRHIEELGAELRESQTKAEEIEHKLEEVQNELQRKEELSRKKNASKTAEEVNEQILTLRQRNLELDAKNEDILKAVRRLKEIHADELNNKDIELQRQCTEAEYQEQRSRELEEQFMDERTKRDSAESDLRAKEELIKRYAAKIKAMRRLLTQYGHYLDTAIEYEALVERSNQILQDKITDGQRQTTSSSASNVPALMMPHRQPPPADHNNNRNRDQ